ncbi:hypothetical protein [Staphylococcus pseudintermedius]|uniref:hypothetical protein n=1 Tax=Staphylococcus pseudintermedius TaxID=283734 RepID=UPI0018F6155A|nr:hypothetical protein [Staphylococcus pseudintermedius]EHT6205174.1 hypothetical protein [Staphylococcus pseudintermedius]EJA1938781.1 hypothetical protein [Staphylococcus pseudintermedius]EJD8520031.1 hypothetical protein [Staphylococcus pseudintermedius]EJG1236848.1 hypothetical protein [Staphylococcus pseudintermedius]EKO8899251.1 hypothetical protein [Staphylococcus pseudintermedius]
MDLKTLNVFVESETFDFAGDAFDFLLEMREKALNELKLLLEKELAIENVKDSEELYLLEDDIYDIAGEDETETDLIDSDIEEIADVEEAVDVSNHTRYDTTIASKIEKFKNFVSYADSIISKNGVHSFTTNDPINEIINEFKKITSVDYGTYTVLKK